MQQPCVVFDTSIMQDMKLLFPSYCFCVSIILSSVICSMLYLTLKYFDHENYNPELHSTVSLRAQCTATQNTRK